MGWTPRTFVRYPTHSKSIAYYLAFFKGKYLNKKRVYPSIYTLFLFTACLRRPAAFGRQYQSISRSSFSKNSAIRASLFKHSSQEIIFFSKLSHALNLNLSFIVTPPGAASLFAAPFLAILRRQPLFPLILELHAPSGRRMLAGQLHAPLVANRAEPAVFHTAHILRKKQLPTMVAPPKHTVRTSRLLARKIPPGGGIRTWAVWKPQNTSLWGVQTHSGGNRPRPVRCG